MLKSAGGNLTERHIEEVSLSALFLLDAAKKTDRAFGVASQTTAHSIRDPSLDVSKMVKHLVENKVSQWKIDWLQLSPIQQMKATKSSVALGWMKRCHVAVYNSPPSENEDLEIINDDYLHGREVNNDDIDIDYELHDVL